VSTRGAASGIGRRPQARTSPHTLKHHPQRCMPITANILFFPAERASAAAHRYDTLQSQAAALAAASNAEAWPEGDTDDNGNLEMVASLAAAPSQSLAGLVTKVEVLVARLTPDAGLCLAEASLLVSRLSASMRHIPTNCRMSMASSR
jgi:hypothetical protein